MNYCITTLHMKGNAHWHYNILCYRITELMDDYAPHCVDSNTVIPCQWWALSCMRIDTADADRYMCDVTIDTRPVSRDSTQTNCSEFSLENIKVVVDFHSGPPWNAGGSSPEGISGGNRNAISHANSGTRIGKCPGVKRGGVTMGQIPKIAVWIVNDV